MRRTAALLLFALSIAAVYARAPAAGGSEPLPVAIALSGSPIVHVVRPGESFVTIGARHGIDAAVLARENGRRAQAALAPGEELSVDARHLVPPGLSDGLLVNVPQRHLFLLAQGELVREYPITVGSRGWPTPLGDFTVRTREVDPTWEVPASIQAEMRREGRRVITVMPPCPENPLGRYWLGLSLGSVGIHGTNAPASIYRTGSHGCIRLHPDDIADLFGRVSVGTPGRVVYEPVLIAVVAGRVWLEAHPDAYRRAPDAAGRVDAALGSLGVQADPARVAEALTRRDGVARDVTRVTAPPTR